MTEEAPVRYYVEGAFHVAELRRERSGNSVNGELLRHLRSAIAAAERDSQARGFVLTSTGSKFFCTGGDVRYLSDLPDNRVEQFTIEARTALFELESMSLPTVCVIDGYAIGGGLELALACDYRLATPSAEFSMPQIALGIVPGWHGTQRLVRLIGYRHARDLLFATRRIVVATAFEIGLVDGLVDTDASIPDAVEKFAEERKLGRRSALPIARRVLRESRATFDTGTHLTEFMALWASEEHREAETKFAQKSKEKPHQET